MTFPFFRRGLRLRVPAENLPATLPTRRRVEAQQLWFPLSGGARIAVLEAGFRADRNMQMFTAGLDSENLGRLRSYAPESLVAPLPLALSLAERKRRGLFELPSLRTAIVVLTSLDDSPFADDHRDLLWRTFRVPVFEQLRGWDGAIIARECEVHDGLHIDESAATLELHEDELLATQPAVSGDPIIRARTGLTGEIVTGLCECGAETPRLRGLAWVRGKTASPGKASVAAA